MGGENPLEGVGRKPAPREARRRRIKKPKISALTRISFLPSVFTMLNLFLGYQALIHIIGARRNFKMAVYYITASVIMDGFDGTIARLTKTESSFGMQLDSLVDAVTFGLVTSVLAYAWGFQTGTAPAGAIVSFVFLSAGLIRLARFNVFKEAHVAPANIFIGMPIPIGALSIGSVVLAFDGRQPLGQAGILLFSLYVLLVSLLMISNIRYRTIKNIAQKDSLKMLFLVALVVSCLIIFPDETIPLLTLLYMISPVFFLILSRRPRGAETPGADRKSEPSREKRGEA
jgi:CDP-diacylglycerol--serine O-phosphatidyltransferase